MTPSKKVRTRVAPSPTGYAHVGTAYTSLFNYAFAKKNKGEFILRLEDTDIKRNVKGAEKAIYEGLSWMGLSWDEGADKGGPYAPYKQSEKLDVYRKKAEELVKAGKAYGDEGAIRFKNTQKDMSWDDLIRGKITFPGKEVTDFVIIKSDGYPTYNFAVVIDDIEMQITHVIRGEEHISNTPRQLALYDAFDTKPPFFAHHPTLRNTERKKLSKRRDPVDLRIFKDKGYLPEALLNFLALLGWSHPEQKEIFSLEEFVSLFDIKDVKSAGPIFDMKKLDWMNGEYIRNLSNDEFIKRVKPFIQKDSKDLDKIAPLVKERIKTLSEFGEMSAFFVKEPRADKKLFGKNYQNHISKAYEALESLDKWTKEGIDSSLLGVVGKEGFKTGEFFMDLRIAITARKVTPPINESLVILGKEQTIKRLKKLI